MGHLYGESPTEAVTKGYGIIGAGIAGGMGAATNLLSADVQYRSGREQGKKMEKLMRGNKK